VIATQFDCWLGGDKVPPHSVSLPKGREDPRITAAGSSGVPSPLGEKDRMRGDFAIQSGGSPMRQQIALLPDGSRLHLQDGPIDLVIGADGEPDAVASAYRAAARRFLSVLDELCAELPLLRAQAGEGAAPPQGRIAQNMARAVQPFADSTFITPMAAVAGAVADEILGAMLGEAPLSRAYVNNGGDIALHLAPGESFRIGMADRPDQPSLFGKARIGAGDGIGGIATSGWRGRSFSLGIADSVTTLASSAAKADAAATIIANAVDLPDHPGIIRRPACSLQPDNDLGSRLVTCSVPPLAVPEIEAALDAGARMASKLFTEGLISGAALHLLGITRTIGPAGRTVLRRDTTGAIPLEGYAHA
jgi:uncharacterized protein